MTANKIKYVFKLVFFSIGLLLFAFSSLTIFIGFDNGGMGRKLADMTIAEGISFLFFSVGGYIIVGLLKGRTVTKWETDEEKEILKKNRNNGN